MTHEPRIHLRIAYGDQPSRRTEVLGETLRNQGHEVLLHPDKNAFLSAPEPDIYVIGRALADGTAGLDLLAALREVGRRAPVVLIDEQPSFEDMRRAVELGAADFVLRPLEPGVLAVAIARAADARTPAPRPIEAPPSHACERRYTSDAASVGRAAREISAFLVNEGVVSAHRVRIASALAELIDNACRHAYARAPGEIVVCAEVEGARVHLEVVDQGRGFDAQRARLERVPAALPGARRGRSVPSSSTGLGRVERLCEACEIDSGPGGTRVRLFFELTPVRFDEEAEHLSQTDFLDPNKARELVASLRRGDDLSRVQPSLVLTIGRIIGGLSPERTIRRR